MTFHDRILKLREHNHRTAFEFRFEDLFSKEEWLEMSIADQNLQKSNSNVTLIK